MMTMYHTDQDRIDDMTMRIEVRPLSGLWVKAADSRTAGTVANMSKSC